MKSWLLCAAMALAGLLAMPADAELLVDPPMVDPVTGDDSGWTVSWAGAVVTVQALEVDLDASTLTVFVLKDFGLYEVLPDRLEFPDALISFNKAPGAAAVSRIIVHEELIYNDSGAAWTEFNWTFMEEGPAAFVVDASAGWNPAPFTVCRWLDGDDQEVTGNLALKLTACDGVLPSGQSFAPASDLVIQHLTGDSIKLKEFVVPEPATFGLLAVGAGMLALRCRRRAAVR